MSTMKTTTALVGVGAAAVAGVAIYFAFRKPEEEKPAAATPTPSKLGPGSTPAGGSGSSRGGSTDTTHSIIDHQSIDQIVDVIRGSGSRGLKLPGQTTQTQQQPVTQQTQTLEPTGSDSQWNKAKEAGL